MAQFFFVYAPERAERYIGASMLEFDCFIKVTNHEIRDCFKRSCLPGQKYSLVGKLSRTSWNWFKNFATFRGVDQDATLFITFFCCLALMNIFLRENGPPQRNQFFSVIEIAHKETGSSLRSNWSSPCYRSKETCLQVPSSNAIVHFNASSGSFCAWYTNALELPWCAVLRWKYTTGYQSLRQNHDFLLNFFQKIQTCCQLSSLSGFLGKCLNWFNVLFRLIMKIALHSPISSIKRNRRSLLCGKLAE